jgi:hypothetical protein
MPKEIGITDIAHEREEGGRQEDDSKEQPSVPVNAVMIHPLILS